MKNRRIFAGKAAALLLVTALTGCGEKTVDYDVESLGSPAAESAAHQTEGENTDPQATEAEAIADCGLRRQFPQREWKEDLSADFPQTAWQEDPNHILKINAAVTVPEADSMSVLQVKNCVFTPEFKQTLLQGFFGSTAIYSNERKDRTKAQLQKDLDGINEMIQTYEELLLENPTSEIWLEELQNFRKQQAECMHYMETASVEGTVAEDYTGMAYWADRNGVKYMVQFAESVENMYDDEETAYGMKKDQVFIKPEDPKQVASDWVGDAEEWYATPPSLNAINVLKMEQMAEGNQCSMTRQEAIDYVGQYLTAMGVPGAVCVADSDLYWVVQTGEEEKGFYVKDGYCLRFHIGIDGVSVGSFGTEQYYLDVANRNPIRTEYSMDTYAEAFVSSKGLVSLKIQNPVSVQRVVEDVKLLPFQQICEIMRAELGSGRAFEGKIFWLPPGLPFDHMELIYFRLRDREQEYQYSYVPVWRLSHQEFHESDPVETFLENPFDIYNEVLINAMDGSVIHIEDEVSSVRRE